MAFVTTTDDRVSTLERSVCHLTSGFVILKSNWSVEAMRLRGPFAMNAFKKAKVITALLETECTNILMRLPDDCIIV